MPLVIRPHDLVREPLSVSAAQRAPVDLLASSLGWIYRAARRGSSICVEHSTDAGSSFSPPVVLNTNGAVDGAEDGAAPSLMRDGRDHLWCWYHDDADVATGYYSRNQNISWSAWATHADLKWPRAVLLDHVTIFAAYADGSILFYTSEDFAATLSGSPISTVTDAAVGAFTLRAGRRSGDRTWLHLVYRADDGRIVARFSSDGALSWSAATELAEAGAYPAYALGSEVAAFAYWDGDTLNLGLTDETYHFFGESAAVAPAGFAKANLGLVWLESQHLYASGLTGGSMSTQFTPNRGISWSAPA